MRFSLPVIDDKTTFTFSLTNEPVYKFLDNPCDDEITYDILVPSNMYIIGTMNNTDINIGCNLDRTIKSRFEFINMNKENSINYSRKEIK